MRIIAGSKRRMLLETPEGMGTRPTQDRIKETLFNMIGPDVYDSCFLDLFSGSGQMGIEALSRGAKKAYFVEQDKAASNVIKRNLEKAAFTDNSKLFAEDVFSALKRLKNEPVFDYIFMDPPYNKLLEKSVLEQLKDCNFVGPSTIIIVEASLETDFSYADSMGYIIDREKTYKTNKHIFLTRK